MPARGPQGLEDAGQAFLMFLMGLLCVVLLCEFVGRVVGSRCDE